MTKRQFVLALLCFYTGLTGCNNVQHHGSIAGNNGSGDLRKRKTKSTSFDNSVSYSRSTVPSNPRTLLQGARLSMINTAKQAEKVARLREKCVENAIKSAKNAKELAERLRESTNKLDTTTSNKLLQGTRLSMINTAKQAEKVARLREKCVEDAIKSAQNAQALAEKLRESTNKLDTTTRL